MVCKNREHTLTDDSGIEEKEAEVPKVDIITVEALHSINGLEKYVA